MKRERNQNIVGAPFEGILERHDTIVPISKTTTQEKGITLIALVISIIILVILAAVAVRGITGDEPLIKKTRNNSRRLWNRSRKKTNRRSSK